MLNGTTHQLSNQDKKKLMDALMTFCTYGQAKEFFFSHFLFKTIFRNNLMWFWKNKIKNRHAHAVILQLKHGLKFNY